MQVLTLFRHPYALMVSFLLVIVNGEHIGGPYVLFLLFGLFGWAPYSVLGLLGMALLLFGIPGISNKGFQLLSGAVNLLGWVLLLLSLVHFYSSRTSDPGSSLFSNLVPLGSLLVFALLAVCYLVSNVLALWQNISGRSTP